MLVGLVEPTSGTVLHRGVPVTGARRGRRRLAADVQIVFQDPDRSLDPRMTVARLVAEPLRIHGRAATEQTVHELLDLAGLPRALADRRPHELSAGERQRVALARALALGPALLVLDEPVSSLDVLAQAGILELLADLKRRLGLALLFVSHDLAVVRAVADDVAVMHAGRIVESGPVDEIFAAARHPYTRSLLAASPSLTRAPAAL